MSRFGESLGDPNLAALFGRGVARVSDLAVAVVQGS